MPVRVVAVALIAIGAVAVKLHPQAAMNWPILLPILFDRKPWWLSRDKMSLSDLALMLPLSAALLALTFSAPTVVVVGACGSAVVCVIIRSILLERRCHTAR